MWYNFRVDFNDRLVYWQTSPEPVDGDDRFNLEVRPEWESDPGRLFLMPGVRAQICQRPEDCPQGASVEVPPGDYAGFHEPTCGAVQNGMDLRNGWWRDSLDVLPEP